MQIHSLLFLCGLCFVMSVSVGFSNDMLVSESLYYGDNISFLRFWNELEDTVINYSVRVSGPENSTYSDSRIFEKLVSYYNFESNIIDKISSVEGVLKDPNAIIQSESMAYGAPYNLGKSVLFDDNNKNYFKVADSNSSFSENMSWGLWYNPRESVNSPLIRLLVAKGNWDDELGLSYGIACDEGTGGVFCIADLGDQRISTELFYGGMNDWSHVFCILNTTDLSIYGNGVFISSKGYYGQLNVNNNPLFIGSDLDGDRMFNGLFDEFRIYNASLTSEQVSELFLDSALSYERVGLLNESFGPLYKTGNWSYEGFISFESGRIDEYSDSFTVSELNKTETTEVVKMSLPYSIWLKLKNNLINLYNAFISRISKISDFIRV